MEGSNFLDIENVINQQDTHRIAAHYWYDFGLNVIPIIPGGKRPSVPWNFVDDLTHEKIDASWMADQEVGFIVDHTLIILDVDSPESLAALLNIEKQFNIKPNCIIKTTKGEHHYFKRNANSYAKQQGYNSENHPNKIDVKTGRTEKDGRSLVVLPPSTGKHISINEAKTAYDLVEVSQTFIDAIFTHNGEPHPRLPIAIAKVDKSYTTGQAEIMEILSFIPPANDYSIWLEIGMALHHKYDGEEEGLIIWDEWSLNADNYSGFENLKYKWNSFSTERQENPVTFASICKRAKAFGADLSSIRKKYDHNGNLLPTYDRLIEVTKSLNTESHPSDIEAIIKSLVHFSPIQRRKVMNGIKIATGLPISEQRAQLAEHTIKENSDHLSIAQSLCNELGQNNYLVDGKSPIVWFWDDSGYWNSLNEHSIESKVQAMLPNHLDAVNNSDVTSITKVLKRELLRPDHKWNQGGDDVINTVGGELHLKNGKWVQLPHNKKSYRQSILKLDYDPAAKAPRFKKFLKEVFAKDADAEEKIQCLLEMIGYSFVTHCRYEAFIILVGRGSNGKSVLLDVLNHMLGDFVAAVQPKEFANKFQRANLHRKLANIVSELPQGGTIPDDMLKSMVSGERITVEHKNQDPFDYHPYATMWFGTNHMPHTRDDSNGIFRRARVLPFNVTFEGKLKDTRLKEKLIKESPGILNLALQAYATAVSNGEISDPTSSVESKCRWKLETDQVAQFIDECIVKDESQRLPRKQVYDFYQLWANGSGIRHAFSSKRFYERLRNMGFVDRKTNGNWIIEGLKLHYEENGNNLE